MPKDLYVEFMGEADVAPTDTRTVPNVQPKLHNVPYKLAIIGEAPGKDEIDQGIPFVGWSGQDLDRMLSRYSILRDACFIGNICQHRPFKNQIANFDWDGPEIQSGLKQLKNDLTTFNPNIILCLGASALHGFMLPSVVPKKRKTKDGLAFVVPNPIGDWRGSFFMSSSDSPAPFTKCIASYHPAACLRNYEWTPYLLMDIKRAFDEATTKELVLPVRNLDTRCDLQTIVERLDKILLEKTPIGTDIEGYWNNWSCISFAESPTEGFIVPLTHRNGASYWTVDEEVQILKRVIAVLSEPKITKIWQNGLYDRFCTQYGYGIVVRGPNKDIMLRHWERLCEVEKGLSVQLSIYTKEPYYKTERHTEDIETFWRYCCKDSAGTIEVYHKVTGYLSPDSLKHAEFNETLTNTLLYAEIRGIRYNTDLVKTRLHEVESAYYGLQYELDKLMNRGLKTEDRILLRCQLRDEMCYKNDPTRVKKGSYKSIEQAQADFDVAMRILMGEGPLSPSDRGRLSSTLGLGLNVGSDDQMKDYLYGTLGLKKQYNNDTGALTTNYEALITLRKDSKNPVLPILVDMSKLGTRLDMLQIKADKDGRVRCGYNIVGTETGRISSYKSPTGSGYNMQTIPNENELRPIEHPLHNGMRDLLTADEGCFLAKCDLKGADGWTIGANLAALGDSTMLDDLCFGLKPANICCLDFRQPGRTLGKSRVELLEISKEIQKSSWDYFALKVYIWGHCYLMGPRKGASEVFQNSEGSVSVSESDMQRIRDLVNRRYNVPLWWKAMENKLFKQASPPRLQTPSGHTRIFFGRRSELLGQALAHEPQMVTTYATKLAAYKLWTDPDNRRSRTDIDLTKGYAPLRVEPLHFVHDELLVQFRKEDLDFAKAKIKEWFNNTIRIAGIDIVIPYDGSYGSNWAMDNKSKVGSI